MTTISKENELLKNEIDEWNDIIWSLRIVPQDGNEAFSKLEELIAKSKSIDYVFGEARTLLNMGRGVFLFKHDLKLSIEVLSQARELFLQLDEPKWVANTDLTEGIVKTSAGNPESAVYVALRGMDYFRDNQEDSDYCMACYVLGTVYKDLKKNDEAEMYYQFGIDATKSYTVWSARLYAGLSNVKTEKGKFDEALPLAQKGLELLKADENKIGISRSLTDIGNIFFGAKNFQEALSHFQQALSIRREMKHLHFISGSLIDVAKTHEALSNYDDALESLYEAEKIVLEINHDQRLTIVYRSIADILKIKKEFEGATNYFEKLVLLTNQVVGKEREQKIQQSENKLLKEKEEEIERLRNVELKNAYDIIALKNKEITDSINYAERLQKCLMAGKELLNQNLPEYFIYFNPKEAVSGDFYWAASTSSAAIKSSTAEHALNAEFVVPAQSIVLAEHVEARFYLCCADSTGHGVPGAIMSMMNMNSLNEVIKEGWTEADKILNRTREIIINTLANDGSETGGKDGMDATLLVFNEDKSILEFALANNPLILIRNNELIEFKPDKMPVGKHDQQHVPFTKHVLKIEKNDMIYVLTDGYADQFGGAAGKPGGKKFKFSSLKDFLLSIATKSMQEQEILLHQNLINWKGELEQIDDICIIGIRF